MQCLDGQSLAGPSGCGLLPNKAVGGNAALALPVLRCHHTTDPLTAVLVDLVSLPGARQVGTGALFVGQ